MAYTKTQWLARVCTNPNKYTKSQETANTVVLINTPDPVSVPGTLFTPENMNHIEQGIGDAHDLIAAESQARQQEDAATLTGAKSYADAINTAIRGIIKNHAGLPLWDDKTYTLKFSTQDGQTLVIDLPLELLAAGLDYDKQTKELVLTKQDGSKIRVSVVDLIDVYIGSKGTQIQITVESGNVIKATLLAGTITEAELSAALSAKIDSKAEKAALEKETAERQSADNGLTLALNSESQARQDEDQALRLAINELSNLHTQIEYQNLLINYLVKNIINKIGPLGRCPLGTKSGFNLVTKNGDRLVTA
jgi:hypothetical protein